MSDQKANGLKVKVSGGLQSEAVPIKKADINKIEASKASDGDVEMRNTEAPSVPKTSINPLM